MSPTDSFLPRHVGIIMDGNGRWAKERGLPRNKGHREGLEVAKKIVARIALLRIPYLSLYTFSTENWRRTKEEVSFLMGLIKTYLHRHYDFYKDNEIRILHGGDLDSLPKAVRDEILLVERETAPFNKLYVNLLINYGGRDEILRALRRSLDAGRNTEYLGEDDFSAHFDRPEFPDLDLVIRTGGELRLSNFMIWQAAYAELYFSKDYWPDWTEDHLDGALEEYSRRRRRFGATP